MRDVWFPTNAAFHKGHGFEQLELGSIMSHYFEQTKWDGGLRHVVYIREGI
jgi:hypothetical protein